MTTASRAFTGMLLSCALLFGAPQSRATSQISPLQIEVLRSGRVMRPSAVFRAGENIQVRAQATRRGVYYFFERESGAGAWKPLKPRLAFGGRIASVRFKAAPHGSDVLVVLGFEELRHIDPATIATEQTAAPGETVAWRLPEMAVSLTRLRVR